MLYAKLSNKIERMSKIIYFIKIKIALPLNTLPSLLITIFNYYVLDMQDESFLLSFPILYEPDLYELNIEL